MSYRMRSVESARGWEKSVCFDAYYPAAQIAKGGNGRFRSCGTISDYGVWGCQVLHTWVLSAAQGAKCVLLCL